MKVAVIAARYRLLKPMRYKLRRSSRRKAVRKAVAVLFSNSATIPLLKGLLGRSSGSKLEKDIRSSTSLLKAVTKMRKKKKQKGSSKTTTKSRSNRQACKTNSLSSLQRKNNQQPKSRKESREFSKLLKSSMKRS